ncbi:hypothetical protein RJ639_003395 [Escallonia herrerae]|uniref:peptidylprolyl isomerase n=1 Tax=Escallonia herrerae TaxID=1293975 RepID=A0AA89B1M0_9ASTE|nr:hypothetical protein RJ639_003395 [Escallonia herrerae]
MAVDGDAEQNYKPQKKKTATDEEKRKKKIVPGSLMKALIRPGGGDATPADGHQAVYHCTIRTLDGVVVESTRSEFGGKGTPTRHVLGKSKMILGLLEGIPTMLKGEIAIFKIKPELHYAEDHCPVSVSESFPKDAELHFEIELIDFSKVKARILNSLSIMYLCGTLSLKCSSLIELGETSRHPMAASMFPYFVKVYTKVQVISEDLGVLKKVIDEGQGWESPREPYEVKAWISAKTGDGKSIISRTDGEPFFFTFGKSEVPKGLEMGIGTMSRQEKAVIYVTSQYLTRCPLLPVVEGIDEVHFDVELVHFIQVRDVLGDGRLIKRRVHDGRGEFPMDCPLQDSLLRVHYKGMILNEEKNVFYDTKVDNRGQPLMFSSGEGLVPEGFEMCVRLMLPGEIALVTCPPDYAYDKFPRPSNVPEGAHIQWEIELVGFETPKDWTGMSFRSIMDDVEKTKGTGNRLFKEGKFELAKAKYEKAFRDPISVNVELCQWLTLLVLREFNHVNPQDDDEGKEFSNTRNLLNLNVAACLLKMGEWKKSIEACNKVIEANPGHVKALYRRGMAYMSAGDFEEARNDFNKMMSIDKSSEPNARAALLQLKQKEQVSKENIKCTAFLFYMVFINLIETVCLLLDKQEVERKARKQFKGLFDKKPGEIAEAGVDDKAEEISTKNFECDNLDDTDSIKEEEEVHQAAAPRHTGFLSQLWSSSRSLFTALGVQRCTIL